MPRPLSSTLFEPMVPEFSLPIATVPSRAASRSETVPVVTASLARMNCSTFCHSMLTERMLAWGSVTGPVPVAA